MENVGHQGPPAPPADRPSRPADAPASSGGNVQQIPVRYPRPEFQSLILERVSDAVIVIDNDGKITYLNPSAERQYGVRLADALGRALSDVYRYQWVNHGDDAQAAAALAEHGFWRGENRHLLADGRVLHVDSSVSVLQDASGTPVGLVAVIRDITQAKGIEAELRSREERFRRAFSIETVGVLFFTLDGRMIDANASFERMTGYTAAELRDLVHWRQLTAPQFYEVTERTAEELMTRGETPPYEKQMIRKDGSRWWGLFSPRRIAGTGVTAECVEFVIDITDAKRADAALRESDERQRMALDAADLGTWKHDITAGRVDLDVRAARHYGLDRTVATLDDLLPRIHPEDRAGLQQAMAAALDPRVKAPVRAEYRVLRPDGDVRWLSINGEVHFESVDGAERPVIGIGTTRDITEQKRSEELLRDADRRKDEFLAILAHELRNPLAPIRTAVGLLQSPRVPEPLQTRSRDIIERQVAHMTRLIDDLLDVSRLSRGKMTLQRSPLLLDQVLDAAVETARPILEEHGHHFEQRRPASPVCVDGDLARLSQVFANLLNNAAKYTPRAGRVSLEVSETNGSVQVRVADTGQGIAPERLDRIFDLFAQGSGPSAPTVGGLGIGLALARRLVELHGGAIEAFSPGPGRGAVFTVTLPTVVAGGCERAEGTHVVLKHLGRRVLVVDDSADAADTTAALLEAAGCAVRTAYSGERALAEVHVFAPEIVLLDLGMPGVDGLEACRRMRALPNGPSLFVVAVTGWGQDEDRRRTREAGFDAHLVKPVAPDALLDVVERGGALTRGVGPASGR